MTIAQPKKDIPPKFIRISNILEIFTKAPPFANGMMAYAALMELVNEQEDLVWGAEYWKAPRTFHGGVVTDRIYPTHTESFENVEGFAGVTHLIHTKHSIFLSRYGAVQVQLDNGWPVADFLFGSLAKGYYKPHHDIDVFLIFKEANDNALSVAKRRYFSLHEKFRASPDTQYPGEFYTRSQIEGYVKEPICLDLDWRLYDEKMLDRLFVLEVLAGDKTAIFGD